MNYFVPEGSYATDALDPATAAPAAWADDLRPKPGAPTDIVVGEASVRDLSIASNSGIQHKGQYLGLTEEGTTGPDGVRTGLSHLLELGITHLHLLPTYDLRLSTKAARPRPTATAGATTP